MTLWRISANKNIHAASLGRAFDGFGGFAILRG
jgi:hypothetical protein